MIALGGRTFPVYFLHEGHADLLGAPLARPLLARVFDGSGVPLAAVWTGETDFFIIRAGQD